MTCVWDVDFGVGIEGMVGALLGGGGCSREVVREEEGGGYAMWPARGVTTSRSCR